MGVRYCVTGKTARLFMLRVREAMAFSEDHPMDGNVKVDEFALGGYEQNKIGRGYSAKKNAVSAAELTDDGKVKRVYMFIRHIDRDTQVTTDKWMGYRPVARAYKVTQIDSNRGLNFKAQDDPPDEILDGDYLFLGKWNLT